jgi:hypothetical protein
VAEAARDDSLEAYRRTNSPETQHALEHLAGIRDATSATATSNAEILSVVTELKNDPTPRRTLSWAQVSAGIAFLALLATILVSALTFRGEVVLEKAREATAALQHTDDLRRLDELDRHLKAEHREAMDLEKALVQALEQKK